MFKKFIVDGHTCSAKRPHTRSGLMTQLSWIRRGNRNANVGHASKRLLLIYERVKTNNESINGLPSFTSLGTGLQFMARQA
jgi:hypothetical protein